MKAFAHKILPPLSLFVILFLTTLLAASSDAPSVPDYDPTRPMEITASLERDTLVVEGMRLEAEEIRREVRALKLQTP